MQSNLALCRKSGKLSLAVTSALATNSGIDKLKAKIYHNILSTLFSPFFQRVNNLIEDIHYKACIGCRFCKIEKPFDDLRPFTFKKAKNCQRIWKSMKAKTAFTAKVENFR